MSKDYDFKGKTALITGASRGIGLATAHKLAACGATVFLAARSKEKIIQEAEQIITDGGKAFSVVCDVTDYQSVNEAVQACIEQTGRLDFLVNNAGVIEPQSLLLDSDPEEWGRAVDINVKGVFHCMRASLPHLIKSGDGVIVNMSSGAANSALSGWSQYCASKSAAKKLTEVAHVELQDSPVRVVGLSPGTVATDMMASIRDAKINAVSHLDWSTHIPVEWVAEAIAFLCGPEGAEFAGTDFSLKTNEGRQRVGLPPVS